MYALVNTLVNIQVNINVKTLLNALVKILVDALANTLRASRRALPPSPKPPYQPRAGLIGIHSTSISTVLAGRWWDAPWIGAALAILTGASYKTSHIWWKDK